MALWSYVAAGAGFALGFAVPGIGMWVGLKYGLLIGAGIDSYLSREQAAEIKIQDEKKTLLSPATLVSSNVPISLGFGTFHASGNILDFAIERSYRYATDEDGLVTDNRMYFIATGVTANPSEPLDTKIDILDFWDSSVVESEFFPEGGHSKFPDEGQSDYYNKNSRGTLYTMKNLDTGWVHLFTNPPVQGSNSIQITGHFRNLGNPSDDLDQHFDLYLYRKVDGTEEVKRIGKDEWTLYIIGTDVFFTYFEYNVPSGDYKISYEMDDTFWEPPELQTFANVTIIIRDEEPSDPGEWAFNCNWFALKFLDTDFHPSNTNFSLIYDQGDQNPIRNLQAYMTNLDWGLKIPESKIETSSFDTQIARCITDGLTFNGLFTSQISPSDIIKQLLITAKALMVYSQGKFKLIEDTFVTPSKTFEESNTLAESFQYTRKDIGSMISRLKIDFEDSEHSYAVRSVLLDSPTLFQKIGIKETSQFLTGVNTETQAKDIGTYLFRKLRQPGSVVLKASINDADIEPGQMFEAIRPAVQYGGVFRAVEIQEDQKDDIQIAGVAYFPEDEEIVISTEDDFRRGTFSNSEVTLIEDGEVYSSGEEIPPQPPDDWLQLREHRDNLTGASAIAETFTVEADHFRVYSSTAKAGCGYVFVVCETAWLDGKKIEVNWRQTFTNVNILSVVWVRDGAYDRTDDDHFPDTLAIASFGAGILESISRSSSFIQTTDTKTCTLDTAEEESVTVFVGKLNRANVYANLRIYSLKILDADDNVLIDFDLSSVTMEQTGTVKDYGYTGSGP